MPVIGKKGSKRKAWLQFKDGEVLIQEVTKQELFDIHRKATRLVSTGVGGKKEKLDQMKHDRLLVEKAVLDWEGFVDEEGKEIPFSVEAAQDYIDQSVDFSVFVNQSCISLDPTSAEEQKEKEKN